MTGIQWLAMLTLGDEASILGVRCQVSGSALGEWWSCSVYEPADS